MDEFETLFKHSVVYFHIDIGEIKSPLGVLSLINKKKNSRVDSGRSTNENVTRV